MSDQICCSVKEFVYDKYEAIARGQRDSGCCMVDEHDYESANGYQEWADLDLECGTPVDHADLMPGETVLDLDSGAGLDAMIASPLVGENGKVYGIDLAPSMVARATQNAGDVGIYNGFFQDGDVEKLPINDASIDVVIGNCTLNLVPDKEKAYTETVRSTSPGWTFHHLGCCDGRGSSSCITQEGGGSSGCRCGRKRILPKVDHIRRIQRFGSGTFPCAQYYW